MWKSQCDAPKVSGLFNVFGSFFCHSLFGGHAKKNKNSDEKLSKGASGLLKNEKDTDTRQNTIRWHRLRQRCQQRWKKETIFFFFPSVSHFSLASNVHKCIGRYTNIYTHNCKMLMVYGMPFFLPIRFIRDRDEQNQVKESISMWWIFAMFLFVEYWEWERIGWVAVRRRFRCRSPFRS